MFLNIELNSTETLLVGVFVLLVGRALQHKIKMLEKFFIPPPVIGGFLFSILVTISYYAQWFELTIDTRIAKVFMFMFFSTVGFSATFKFLKKGGKSVFLFLICAVLLVCLQNFVGIVVAWIMGKSAAFGLSTASIPLTGGHGTAAAFGPILQEKFHVPNATTITVAAATAGLFVGSLIGGPLGRQLMNKHNLKPAEEDIKNIEDGKVVHMEDKHLQITEHGLFNTVVLIAIAIGFGIIVSRAINDAGLILPGYIGTMLIAAALRNISDATKWYKTYENELEVVGNISLSLFLVLTLMNMELWVLADLALPIIVLLLAQISLMFFYAKYVTFNVMGRDYDAAVMACGHCGFGLGATPNGVANMEAFTALNYPAPQAFFVLPIVGALFIDFANSGVISAILNLL